MGTVRRELPEELGPVSPQREAGNAGAQLPAALDEVLNSRTFSRSEQLRRLLAYLREHLSDADAAAYSEVAIGTTVFGRKDFNPKLDTIVRAEMLRLRRKLEDYYQTEGSAATVRVVFEKNSYRPMLSQVVHNGLPSAGVLVGEAVDAAPRSSQAWFWIGLGTGAAAILAGAIFVILVWFQPAYRPAGAVARHPIWKPFGGADVTIAVSTPLFFRTNNGFQRDSRLNYAADLNLAPSLLPVWPALPLWDRWTAWDDLQSAVQLDRFLAGISSHATFVSARQISAGSLGAQHTIIIGHPRGAPLLGDALGDLDFRAPPSGGDNTRGGFVNVAPKPGEMSHYTVSETSLLDHGDESSPDYALVTSIHLDNGGEVLSIFGNRIQTAGLVTRKLLDPAYLVQLDGKIFGGGRKQYRSLQAVLRVDYSKATPTGAVYVTHRIRQ